ncbi:phytoene/squalene synthase family protein [Sphingomonas sp. RS6]
MRFPGRDAIVATAAESIARGSRSFSAASKLFDRPTRERAWLLYAWCRRCDDLADGQDHGHDMRVVENPQARLVEIRTKTDAALAGQWVGDAAFDALRIFAQETTMPHRFAHDLIEGFALDAAGWRPQDEDDLLRYCYHVAGVVGCMMAVAMGVTPDDDAVLDRACDLGIGFQLANIARDLREDAAAGRCYVPQSWLDEIGLDAADPSPSAEMLALVAARLVDRAGAYEVSGRGGAAALPFRSAWAVLAAADIYGGIARKVAARGTQAWDTRTRTSGSEKLAAIARAFGAASRRSPAPRPAGLWLRPA